jgi:hypothetical protein
VSSPFAGAAAWEGPLHPRDARITRFGLGCLHTSQRYLLVIVRPMGLSQGRGLRFGRGHSTVRVLERS